MATIDASSSDDGLDETDAQAKKRLRKRRKIHSLLAKSKIQGMDTLSDGDTDDAVDINDSDCSESQIQSAMLGRLHAKAPFIGPIANSHLIGMLSGGENDGSYSSPLSQKSGKNMADFDDDDSPCEEELAQLAASPHCLAAFANARGRNLAGTFHAANVAAANAALAATKLLRNAARATENSNRSGLMTANEVSNPSNILLWDLLMDDKIVNWPPVYAHNRPDCIRLFRLFLFVCLVALSETGPTRRIHGIRNGKSASLVVMFQHREEYPHQIY